jgi:hypothetical protein
MSANPTGTLNSLVPDDLRVVLYLSKSALAIVSKILLGEDVPSLVDEYIGSFHRVMNEIDFWHLNLASTLLFKCSQNRVTVSGNMEDKFGEFVANLRPILDKAQLHKREWEDRIEGKPQDPSIPADYDAHETLVNLKDMLLGFQNMFNF